MQCTFAKLLSHNDTSQTIHQGGPLIPKALSPFFQELDRSQDISEAFLKIELQDGYTSLGVVQARYVWYKSKSECHLTNIGPIIPLWTEDDAIRFEILGPAEYRLQLVRQGSELWNEIADQMGPKRLGRCGLLSGDVCDFENFKVAMTPLGRKKGELHNRTFDAAQFQRNAEDRFKRRKRKPSISLHDPDKTSMRARQHDECVARLSRMPSLRAANLTYGGQTGIDLKAEHGDIIVIFEIKTLRGDEMRQFRAANGQLNHYSFKTSEESGNATQTIRQIICTDRHPGKEWLKFATYCHIGVIWLPEKKKSTEKLGATPLACRILRELTRVTPVC